MVQLKQTKNGQWIYLNPRHIVAVDWSEERGTYVVLANADSTFIPVEGTPNEVAIKVSAAC